MDSSEVLNGCVEKMEKRIAALDKELQRIRTGRASINMFDGVKVAYYGTPTPLNQVASLATPDARTITVTPFEKSLIGEIEKAIMKANLGLQPNSDGTIVRVPVPQLTEDRRREIAKTIKEKGEEAKINIRQSRRDGNDVVKKLEKDKEIAEDEGKKLQGQIQKETDKYIARVDERVAAKEKEVMTI